ncbi:hypothetical protein HYFRA_00009282 [Hymenoscyphus fraxineus]|uniref:Uncharacterized protein n=1 Tax=Hymenoscyphus fraxineus TaxID=746836 RepID=A0A9N9PRM2_9HELO|nr:hypothetical protein HYFRA_00009282 [Hymenoscyphus fraxineus]
MTDSTPSAQQARAAKNPPKGRGKQATPAPQDGNFANMSQPQNTAPLGTGNAWPVGMTPPSSQVPQIFNTTPNTQTPYQGQQQTMGSTSGSRKRSADQLLDSPVTKSRKTTAGSAAPASAPSNGSHRVNDVTTPVPVEMGSGGMRKVGGLWMPALPEPEPAPSNDVVQKSGQSTTTTAPAPVQPTQSNARNAPKSGRSSASTASAAKPRARKAPAKKSAALNMPRAPTAQSNRANNGMSQAAGGMTGFDQPQQYSNHGMSQAAGGMAASSQPQQYLNQMAPQAQMGPQAQMTLQAQMSSQAQLEPAVGAPYNDYLEHSNRMFAPNPQVHAAQGQGVSGYDGQPIQDSRATVTVPSLSPLPDQTFPEPQHIEHYSTIYLTCAGCSIAKQDNSPFWMCQDCTPTVAARQARQREYQAMKVALQREKNQRIILQHQADKGRDDVVTLRVQFTNAEKAFKKQLAEKDQRIAELETQFHETAKSHNDLYNRCKWQEHMLIQSKQKENAAQQAGGDFAMSGAETASSQQRIRAGVDAIIKNGQMPRDGHVPMNNQGHSNGQLPLNNQAHFNGQIPLNNQVHGQIQMKNQVHSNGQSSLHPAIRAMTPSGHSMHSAMSPNPNLNGMAGSQMSSPHPTQHGEAILGLPGAFNQGNGNLYAQNQGVSPHLNQGTFGPSHGNSRAPRQATDAHRMNQHSMNQHSMNQHSMNQGLSPGRMHGQLSNEASMNQRPSPGPGMHGNRATPSRVNNGTPASQGISPSQMHGRANNGTPANQGMPTAPMHRRSNSGTPASQGMSPAQMQGRTSSGTPANQGMSPAQMQGRTSSGTPANQGMSPAQMQGRANNGTPVNQIMSPAPTHSRTSSGTLTNHTVSPNGSGNMNGNVQASGRSNNGSSPTNQGMSSGQDPNTWAMNNTYTHPQNVGYQQNAHVRNTSQGQNEFMMNNNTMPQTQTHNGFAVNHTSGSGLMANNNGQGQAPTGFFMNQGAGNDLMTNNNGQGQAPINFPMNQSADTDFTTTNTDAGELDAEYDDDDDPLFNAALLDDVNTLQVPGEDMDGHAGNSSEGSMHGTPFAGSEYPDPTGI